MIQEEEMTTRHLQPLWLIFRLILRSGMFPRVIQLVSHLFFVSFFFFGCLVFLLIGFFVRLFVFRFVLKPTNQKNKQELTLGCSLFRMDNQTQVPLFKSILSLISPYFSFFLSLLKERI